MIDGIDPAMTDVEQAQVIDIIVDVVEEWTMLAEHAPEHWAPEHWATVLLNVLAREGFHVSREAA